MSELKARERAMEEVVVGIVVERGFPRSKETEQRKKDAGRWVDIRR
jgi:hypothetical protein